MEGDKSGFESTNLPTSDELAEEEAKNPSDKNNLNEKLESVELEQLKAKENKNKKSVRLLDNDVSQVAINELIRGFCLNCEDYQVHIEECDPALVKIGPNVIRLMISLCRGQHIEALQRNLANIGRQISRSNIRIQLVPNSNLIAVDIPRKNREFVLYDEVSQKLSNVESIVNMPVLIGRTPEGDDLVRDLMLMPHMLVGVQNNLKTERKILDSRTEVTQEIQKFLKKNNRQPNTNNRQPKINTR